MKVTPCLKGGQHAQQPGTQLSWGSCCPLAGRRGPKQDILDITQLLVCKPFKSCCGPSLWYRQPGGTSGAGAGCGQLAPPVWVRVKLCFCCSLFPQSPPRPRDFLPLHRSVSAVTKHSEDSGADPILNILLSSFLQNIFIEHLLMLSIGDRAANTADTVSVSIEFISL